MEKIASCIFFHFFHFTYKLKRGLLYTWPRQLNYMRRQVLPNFFCPYVYGQIMQFRKCLHGQGNKRFEKTHGVAG